MKRSKLVAILSCLLVLMAFTSCQSTHVLDLEPAVDSIDPANPYATIYTGLFENQKAEITDPGVKRGAEPAPFEKAEAEYAIYIPEGTETRSPVVIILIPDGMTADEFAMSPIGNEWLYNAGKDPLHKFAVAFVEPDGKWNNSMDRSRRNEPLAVYGVFKTINSTSIAEGNAFHSLDKNRVSLVGYEEGAEAALYAAAEYPSTYANLTLIDMPSFSKAGLNVLLSQKAYPYLTSNTNGYGELRNSEVPMPVFTVDSNGEAGKEAAAVFAENNARHQKIDVTEKPELIRCVSLRKNISVDKLYSDYLSSNGRYLGYPGGTIRDNITRDMKGFTLVEDGSWKFKEVQMGMDRQPVIGDDGKPVMKERTHFNKFLVYVPENLPEGPRPLVLALHGNSAALNDLISESRWTDIADEEGIIICFVQGTMAEGGPAPTPGWPGSNAVAHLEHDIEYMKSHYDIDPERIYATGHSLGAMTLGGTIINQKPELCAAYSMNGGMMGGSPVEGKALAPCTGQMAQYDFGAMPATYKAMKSFVDPFLTVNGLDPDTAMKDLGKNQEYGNGEKYNMYRASIDGCPVVEFIGVEQSPHVFMAEEARLAWDFLKHWTRNENGSFYDGKLVELP